MQYWGRSTMVFMEPVKTCRDCGIEKSASEFYAAPRRRDGLGSYCKPCHRARTRAWEDRNPEKMAECRERRSLKERASGGIGRAATRGQLHGPPTPRHHWKRDRRFGLSPGQYTQMLAAQGGVCALCGGVDPGRALAVDHCHETDTVRGLLCMNCNTALGKLGDTAEALQRAVDYLRSAQCR